MRILPYLLFIGICLPTWAQPVLTISDAQRIRTVAPFTYFYEDFTHKLTYDQVARFPLDSFKPVNRQGAIQLGIRLGTVWLRMQVQNQTNAELFLYSSNWKYKRMDVYVLDEKNQLTLHKGEAKLPFADRLAPIVFPLVSVGKHPRTVYLALLLAPQDFFNDYLQLTDMGHAMLYQKQTTFWQGGLAGVYLLVILYSLVFFVRLRDPLIGWYALFVLVNTHWYLDRSGYVLEFVGQNSWYSQFRSYYPLHTIFIVVWAVFLVKFIQLWKYSKLLYYLIIFWIGLDVIDYPIGAIRGIMGQYYGQYYTPIRSILHWLGIEYIGYLFITLTFLLISIIYVSIKDFRTVRWSALAFGIGLSSMLIAMLALYDLSWITHYPFNNYYFIGSFLEIVVLGFVLAQRVNQHRNEQNQTQQQLIVQLQENLRQQNKLLQIRDEIARDLHDEAGATLTSIATSAKVIQKKVSADRPEIGLVLGQMKTDSEEAIHTIRDTVWALNPDNDAPEKLLERMKSVGFKTLIAHEVALSFENEVPVSALPVFSMEQRRNIYFVFKEAIHNIIKHTNATNAQVRIFQQNNDLHIRISDDG